MEILSISPFPIGLARWADEPWSHNRRSNLEIVSQLVTYSQMITLCYYQTQHASSYSWSDPVPLQSPQDHFKVRITAHQGKAILAESRYYLKYSRISGQNWRAEKSPLKNNTKQPLGHRDLRRKPPHNYKTKKRFCYTWNGTTMTDTSHRLQRYHHFMYRETFCLSCMVWFPSEVEAATMVASCYFGEDFFQRIIFCSWYFMPVPEDTFKVILRQLLVHLLSNLKNNKIQ